MDPIAIIAADAAGRLGTVIQSAAASVWQTSIDIAAPVVTAAAPVYESLASGVMALETMCGPQLFTSMLLVGGAFLLLTFGSLIGHRYP